MAGTQYELPDGRVVFASAGLGQDVFMSFTRRESGGLQRYISKALPVRKSLNEAQKDLDSYAKTKKLKPVGLVRLKPFDPEPAA